MDTDKIINELLSIKTYLSSQAIEATEEDAREAFVEAQKTIDNTIVLLKEHERKPIEYKECANAMLKMWMENVVTDGEYYKIMDKLNMAHMVKKI